MGSIVALIVAGSLGSLLGYWAGRRRGTREAARWKALRSCERLIERQELHAGLEAGEQDPRFVGRTLLGLELESDAKHYRSLVALRSQLREQLGLDPRGGRA